MTSEEWQPILAFETRAAADAVSAVLESEEVPTYVQAGRVVAGLDADFTLAVPTPLVHRARWVLAQSQFSDAELTYLATGELSDSE